MDNAYLDISYLDKNHVKRARQVGQLVKLPDIRGQEKGLLKNVWVDNAS